MYEYITGTLVEATPTYAIIECAGVGYMLNISLQSYSQIQEAEQVKLYTHFIVREDAQLLYGFASKVEREWFALLLGVSGVGAATARMVLSTYSPCELQSIIMTENAAALKSVKGLGLRTSQKIIVELTGKVSAVGLQGDGSTLVNTKNSGIGAEALEALVMLGFAKAVSQKSIEAILKESPDVNVETLIRLALKRL